MWSIDWILSVSLHELNVFWSLQTEFTRFSCCVAVLVENTTIFNRNSKHPGDFQTCRFRCVLHFKLFNSFSNMIQLVPNWKKEDYVALLWLTKEILWWVFIFFINWDRSQACLVNLITKPTDFNQMQLYAIRIFKDDHNQYNQILILHELLWNINVIFSNQENETFPQEQMRSSASSLIRSDGFPLGFRNHHDIYDRPETTPEPCQKRRSATM